MYLQKGNNCWLQWGKGTRGLNVSHVVFFMRRIKYKRWSLNIRFVKMCWASALISSLFNQQHTVMHRILWLGVIKWASLNILYLRIMNYLSHTTENDVRMKCFLMNYIKIYKTDQCEYLHYRIVCFNLEVLLPLRLLVLSEHFTL